MLILRAGFYGCIHSCAYDSRDMWEHKRSKECSSDA